MVQLLPPIEFRLRRFGVVAAYGPAPARDGPLPDQAAPELEEKGIPVALTNHPVQSAFGHGDVALGQGPTDGGGAGRRIEAIDRELVGARPEGRVHAAQTVPQVRCPGEHQQERQFAANDLTRVQEGPSNLRRQRMRLIQQNDKRPPTGARGEDVRRQRRPPPVPGMPGDPRDGHVFGGQAGPPRLWQEPFRKQRARSDFRGRQADGLDVLAVGDFLLQPDQQRRLSVAARPAENDFIRRGNASRHGCDARPEEGLFPLPIGEVGRQSSRAGTKRPFSDDRSRHAASLGSASLPRWRGGR